MSCLMIGTKTRLNKNLHKSCSNKLKLKKTQLPQLLSREDLKTRWQMNSRQSVHQVASKPDFPQPVFAFNHGKTPLYLATEIQIFEINHPWVITPGARLAYSYWILHNVID